MDLAALKFDAAGHLRCGEDLLPVIDQIVIEEGFTNCHGFRATTYAVVAPPGAIDDVGNIGDANDDKTKAEEEDHDAIILNERDQGLPHS